MLALPTFLANPSPSSSTRQMASLRRILVAFVLVLACIVVRVESRAVVRPAACSTCPRPSLAPPRFRASGLGS